MAVQKKRRVLHVGPDGRPERKRYESMGIIWDQ